MAKNENTPLFSIDMRDGSVDADCITCLVALPVAIDRMRDTADERAIPDSMIDHTLDAFRKLDGIKGRSRVSVAAAAQDCLYRQVAALNVMDRYTRVYFSRAVRTFFEHLSKNGIRTFYILDNALRDDRFAAVLELFDLAGIATVTPRRDTKEWPELSARIQAGLTAVGHVAYIEPDSAVNHLEAAQTLARQSGLVSTFRNRAPENPQLSIIALPAS